MPPQTVYHLDLDEEKIQAARFALLPGDPFRFALIAERIAALYGGRDRTPAMTVVEKRQGGVGCGDTSSFG